jgi:hypothetical protein
MSWEVSDFIKFKVITDGRLRPGRPRVRIPAQHLCGRRSLPFSWCRGTFVGLKALVARGYHPPPLPSSCQVRNEQIPPPPLYVFKVCTATSPFLPLFTLTSGLFSRAHETPDTPPEQTDPALVRQYKGSPCSPTRQTCA